MTAAMVAVPPEAMRARRRPLALLATWGLELAWSLVVATPGHAWARAAWGAHPDGDAVLWTPGGGDLLAWLADEGAGRVVAVRTTVALVALGIVLAQAPLGALLASLAFGRGDAGRRPLGAALAAGYAMRAFVPLGSLFVIASVLQGVALVTFGLSGAALEGALAGRLGDGGAFTLRVVVSALGVVIAGAIGAVVDVGRAAAVQAVVGADAATTDEDAEVAAALRVGRPSPIVLGLRTIWASRGKALRAALFAWAWRAALGLALVGLGAAAADALGGRAGSALAALVLAHQAVVLGRTALRASWLARASALAARALPAR